MICLTEPNLPSLLIGLEKAISRVTNNTTLDPHDIHKRVKSLYNWIDVAKRTTFVYNKVAEESVKSLGLQLRQYMKTGVIPWLLVISLSYIILKFLEYVAPEKVCIL